MMIVSDSALRAIQTAIVHATHNAVDQNGERIAIGTLDETRLESAALAALLVATGEIPWPSGRKLVLRRPKPQLGPIVREE